MFKVIVSTHAEMDIIEIQNWYDEQRKGLGKEFVLSFSEVIKLLKKHPKLYAEVEQEIHQANISKFPYAIFYSVDEKEQTVDILAVIHTSRNPEFIKRRLKL